jgi:DNA-binding IclR family transcriptional regulator
MKSLETAIAVLKQFTQAKGDLSVAEIAAATGLNRSHLSKILSEFRDGGLLVQDAVTRRYGVGVGLFELGVKYANGSEVARNALPVMRELVDRCRHSATLSILNDDHVLHLMAVEGPLYLDGRWRVGGWLPIHATSAGKVLIAWLDHAELAALLKRITLHRITPLTVTDPKLLRRQLEEIRASGIALTRGESAPGLAALAVPIFDSADRVHAALGLVIPDQLFDAADVNRLRADLVRAARALSLKLGATTYPFGGDELALPPRTGRMRAKLA